MHTTIHINEHKHQMGGEKGTHARDEPSHGGGLWRSPAKDTVMVEAAESVDGSPEVIRALRGRLRGTRARRRRGTAAMVHAMEEVGSVAHDGCLAGQRGGDGSGQKKN